MTARDSPGAPRVSRVSTPLTLPTTLQPTTLPPTNLGPSAWEEKERERKRLKSPGHPLTLPVVDVRLGICGHHWASLLTFWAWRACCLLTTSTIYPCRCLSTHTTTTTTTVSITAHLRILATGHGTLDSGLPHRHILGTADCTTPSRPSTLSPLLSIHASNYLDARAWGIGHWFLWFTSFSSPRLASPASLNQQPGFGLLPSPLSSSSSSSPPHHRHRHHLWPSSFGFLLADGWRLLPLGRSHGGMQALAVPFLPAAPLVRDITGSNSSCDPNFTPSPSS